jgi:hypothetical protein
MKIAVKALKKRRDRRDWMYISSSQHDKWKSRLTHKLSSAPAYDPMRLDGRLAGKTDLIPNSKERDVNRAS